MKELCPHGHELRIRIYDYGVAQGVRNIIAYQYRNGGNDAPVNESINLVVVGNHIRPCYRPKRNTLGPGNGGVNMSMELELPNGCLGANRLGRMIRHLPMRLSWHATYVGGNAKHRSHTLEEGVLKQRTLSTSQ